jgi:hypothetical protein
MKSFCAYSYSPIDEPAFPHGVGGVLVICTETTEHVLAKQRLSCEREHFVQLFDQAPTFLAVLGAKAFGFPAARDNASPGAIVQSMTAVC